MIKGAQELQGPKHLSSLDVGEDFLPRGGSIVAVGVKKDVCEC